MTEIGSFLSYYKNSFVHNDIQCTENNYSTLLYHFLLNAGLNHRQVCREMLTKFEGEESQYLLKRPDITIFDEKINGRFNYTSKGVESNATLKKESLRFIAEFKGSAWRGNNQALSDKGKIVEDIECNLPLWRDLFNKEADYFFFAINLDMPNGISRPAEASNSLSELAAPILNRTASNLFNFLTADV